MKTTTGSDLSPVQLKMFRTVKKYMEEHGFPPTVGELAEILSKTKASVHANLDYLIQKGFLRKTMGKARSLEILRTPHTTVIDVVAIPLVGDVPAGVPIATDEHRCGEVFVEASLIGRDACFALKVTGDSMMDADILDGDTLVVRKQPLAENGDVVVASLDGELTVKRLAILKDAIRLLPENENYKPIEVGFSSDFRIVGKVIATRRLVQR